MACDIGQRLKTKSLLAFHLFTDGMILREYRTIDSSRLTFMVFIRDGYIASISNFNGVTDR